MSKRLLLNIPPPDPEPLDKLEKAVRAGLSLPTAVVLDLIGEVRRLREMAHYLTVERDRANERLDAYRCNDDKEAWGEVLT